jgi:hypothetical protein
MASFFSSFGQSLFGVPNTSDSGAAAGQTAATNAANQFLGQEQSANNAQAGTNAALEQTINGTAPSAADLQLQQTLDQNRRATLAAGAGGTGANAVLARYQATQLGGGQAAAAAQAGAQLRAQEVAQATQQLSANNQGQMNNAGSLYGANLTSGLGYANLANNVTQANAQRDTLFGAAGLGAAGGLANGLGSLGSKIFGSGGTSAPSSSSQTAFVDPFAGNQPDASGANGGNAYWNAV